MAKYETRIQADLDHLSEYIANSLRGDWLPSALLENEERVYGDTKVIFRKYATNKIVAVIYTIKKDEPYIYIEILESGMFTSRMTVEDSGKKYENYLDEIIKAYNPDLPAGKENIYVPPDFMEKLEADIANGTRNSTDQNATFGMALIKFLGGLK